MVAKRVVIALHKWLGLVLALFFLMWFSTGVVLYFVPFPALTPAERFAAMPPLQVGADCCLAVDVAADAAGLHLSSAADARLGMHGDVPVWRVLAVQRAPLGMGASNDPDGAPAAPRWRTLDARSGALVEALTLEGAAQVAQQFSGRRAVGAQWVERDQWTVPQGLDAHRPLVKVRMDGDDGLELYVSPGAAEVVRDTRRAERFWNWLGAVPHWIYPTVLRQFPKAWHHVVVWLSIPGVVVAVTGVVLGVWQLFLNHQRWIPYRKPWMRWHHIGGLAAGVFTLTWMFSGLMSMNPFGVFSPTALGPQGRAAWTGDSVALVVNPREALHTAQHQGLLPLELDVVRIAGQAWYRVRGVEGQAADRASGAPLPQWLVRADGARAAPARALPQATVQERLALLRPDAAAPAIERMDHYDNLYYARTADASATHARPLPVWRARWADGTAVYADPASGRVLLRADDSTRWQRLLYHGLHRLDFAPLLVRPSLRTALVVGLSLLGVAMCITACVLAWRVAVPARRRASGTSAQGSAARAATPRSA